MPPSASLATYSAEYIIYVPPPPADPAPASDTAASIGLVVGGVVGGAVAVGALGTLYYWMYYTAAVRKRMDPAPPRPPTLTPRAALPVINIRIRRP
jgi:hypothetical protein